MKTGEREARFRQWATEHGGLFVHVARGFVGRADQDDLVQEMLLAVWHAVPAFRGDASPATFLYRIAQNTALTWQRRKYRQPVTQELHEEHHPAAPASLKVERSEALYRAIRQLTDADRTVVLLYLDELPYREIAAITGLSESNVGVRLNRMRARLAAAMQENVE